MKILSGIVLTLFIGLQVSAQDANRPIQPDLPGDLMLDFGFSYWNKKLDQLPVKPWGSNAVSIYYGRRFEINDHISFHPAAGFAFEKYAFREDYTWLDESGTVNLDTLSGGYTFSKNKLNITYFEVPVEFRIHPLGTKDGEGWFIGIGGVAGVRMGAHTKIKYEAENGTHKGKVYDDFGLKGYRYGVQFRFGFRNIHFYYKNYLSDLFNNYPESSNRMPRASTIGINISGF